MTMVNKLRENIDKDFVMFCIGTPTSDIDCLGAMVGDILIENGIKNVFGTTENPIDASNIKDTFFKVAEEHGLNKILSIDACLSDKEEDLGKVIFRKNMGISPRSGIEPYFMLCDIGQHSIIAVTTCIKKMQDGSYERLDVSEDDIKEMARTIADDILVSLR